jgi:hypothetical protein
LTKEQLDKAYELLDVEDSFYQINDLCREFDEDHDYIWQVGFNGRSGGYLVLYRGGYDRKTIFTFENNRTDNDNQAIDYADGYGWLTKDEAIKKGVFQKEIKRIHSYPGKDVDQGEDFSEWTMDELRDRVKLVQEFDKLTDDCLAELLYMIENCEVEEETYCVKKTRKVLKEATPCIS